MSAIFRSNRSRPTAWARRVALFALIALEAAVALAPLLEPHHSAPASHVEPAGTSHVFVVHDDATCAVCTLRSIRVLPSTASAELLTAAPMPVVRSDAHVVAPTRGRRAHASRAPPIAA
jgi:hypothetical protein